MIDGDLLSRWDTAGPQDPTSAVTIDLGAPKQVEGVETLIGGYLADFPRALDDRGVERRHDLGGGVGGTAGADDLHLRARNTAHRARSAFRSTARARLIRLRQTGADPVFYWSIAELHVYGS